MKFKRKRGESPMVPLWFILPVLTAAVIFSIRFFGDFRWWLMDILTAPLESTAAWGFVHFVLGIGLLPLLLSLIYLGLLVARSKRKTSRFVFIIIASVLVAAVAASIPGYASLYQLPIEVTYVEGFWHWAMAYHDQFVNFASFLQLLAPILALFVGVTFSQQTEKAKNQATSIDEKGREQRLSYPGERETDDGENTEQAFEEYGKRT